MRKTSETRPQALVQNEFGGYEFNWAIEETENGFTYESIDVVGELTRANVKYAMMRERYTPEEITAMENAYAANPKTKDLGVKAYFAVKNWIESILTAELDPNIQ